jgi:hypothetical protein
MDMFVRSKSKPNLLLSPISNNNKYLLTTKGNKKIEITLEDSPKKINDNTLKKKTGSLGGIDFRSINPITTLNNSPSLHGKKFSMTNNIPTNYSKMVSLNNTSMSKNMITNYISSSTLQSGSACYTIPREKRFLNNYSESQCSTIYNLPEFKRIGITIPHSIRKSSFIKNDNTPSPQDYVFTTLFDDNLKSKKGISFSTKHSIKVTINI